jgi:hypothetical protein
MPIAIFDPRTGKFVTISDDPPVAEPAREASRLRGALCSSPDGRVAHHGPTMVGPAHRKLSKPATWVA